MAKFFLHGENVAESRERLNELIVEFGKEVKETVRLAGDKIALGEIKQALEAHSLFGGERLVIIEGLLGSTPGNRQGKIMEIILQGGSGFPLILWESREIKGILLSKFKKDFQVEIFKIPATVFKFLDSLSPEKKQQVIFWLHQIDKKEPEIIFYLLCQRIRQLILAKDLGKKGLEDFQGWQQARLLNQAAKFKLSQLLEFYCQLLETDYQQKTGRAPLSLFSTLELLLVNL